MPKSSFGDTRFTMRSLASIDQQYFSGDGDQPWHLQTNRIHDRENIVQLRLYRLDLARKKTPALHQVLVYYEGLRRHPGIPPLREDFDEVVPLELGLSDGISITDVSAPEIEKAWIRRQANTPFQWISPRRGVRVTDFPIKIYSDLVIQSFLIVRETAESQFGRVTAALDNRLYDYWRLALPFATKGTHVDQIMAIMVNQLPIDYHVLR